VTVFAIALCLLVSFVYSGIEAGLLSLNRVRLRSRLRAGDQRAARLDRLLAHPERLLVTVLLVTNFADVAALVLVADALVQRLGTARGYPAALLVLLPVYVLGVQLLPKSLFRRFPYRALAALAGLLEGTRWLLTPLLRVGSLLARALPWTRPNASDAAGQQHRSVFVAREELKKFAADSERAGELSPAERGMIHTVVDFRAVCARDVAQPLPAPLVLAPADLTVAAALAHAAAHALDCVPLLAANGEGQLVALLETFPLLLDRNPQRPLAAAGYLRRPPVVVRPDDPAYGIIRRLRIARVSFAAVVDAGTGRLTGIIRARSLVERLVRGAETSGEPQTSPAPVSGA